MAVDLSAFSTDELLSNVRQVADRHPNFRDSHFLLLAITEELGNRAKTLEMNLEMTDRIRNLNMREHHEARGTSYAELDDNGNVVIVDGL